MHENKPWNPLFVALMATLIAITVGVGLFAIFGDRDNNLDDSPPEVHVAVCVPAEGINRIEGYWTPWPDPKMIRLSFEYTTDHEWCALIPFDDTSIVQGAVGGEGLPETFRLRIHQHGHARASKRGKEHPFIDENKFLLIPSRMEHDFVVPHLEKEDPKPLFEVMEPPADPK